jgi:hypothetical protein
MPKILYLLFFLLLISCKQEEYKNINPYNRNNTEMDYSLELSGKLSFKLDSVTSNMTKSSQYDSVFFSFLSNNNEIIGFNHITRNNNFKIPLPIQGITSYYIQGPDSIFLYNYDNNTVSIMNSVSEIKRNIQIEHTAKYFPSPIAGISPLIVNGDKIVISGNMSGEYIDENENNRPASYILDIKTGQIEYIVSYPKLYRDYNWGGGLFRWVYSTYVPFSKTIVYSFPADHFVYTINLFDKKINSYYAGSTYIDYISSLPQGKLLSIDSDDKIKHFVENHSYSNLIYDMYNDVFYRIAELKIKYDGVPGWRKKMSIIILNNDFNVVGETQINENHASTYRYTLFVTSKGLHIQQKSDEDQMLFNIYKLMPNEK